jgi:quinol monooxygenase YgiN
MYGTIARLHPLPGRLDELKEELSSFGSGGRPAPPGFRHGYVFVPDRELYDRPTVFLVAVFDDKASYQANADSPEQDADYQRMRALLADDPDWMDGTFTGP